MNKALFASGVTRARTKFASELNNLQRNMTQDRDMI